MSDWAFGTVIGARKWPTVRAMLIGPAVGRSMHTVRGPQPNWWAIVLRDAEPVDNWTPGSTITLSPDDADIWIIEEGVE